MRFGIEMNTDQTLEEVGKQGVASSGLVAQVVRAGDS
jgi:DNA-directed RNA polymerase sigma subunit (sigma70/sigma32)